MTTNVGEIYYEVSADVAPLLQAQRQADKALDNMEQSFNKTNKAADALDTGLSRLSSAIKGVIAASALREMAGLVQKYQEMAERVQMATSSQAEFEMVQQRLLTTANGTYRSLQEAQELYIRTADSLRSMQYTTNQAIDVQDSMSYAFVKNATSADRANNAIDAFSKSINTGKVAADQWETITSAIPSVINDIAAASKMTGAQIRELGAAGKLTAKQLTEGLRQSLEANTAAAAGMSNNLVDASVRIKTAITAILVAFEGETGVIQGFTNGLIASADAMLKFSQNSDKMTGLIDASTTAALVLAGVLGSRYVGALVQSTAAKVQSITATRQQILADAQAAQSALFSATSTQRKAVADKEAALSSLALAQAEYNVAKGSAAEMLAMDALVSAKTRATTASLSLAEAEIAQAAAQTRAAAAARSASIGIGLARGALSLIGGPAGAAMLAASAIFYFWQKSQQAKQEAIAFADGLDKLNGSMKVMSNTALRGSIADANVAIKGQQDALSDLSSEIEDLTEKRDDYIQKGKQFGTTIEQGNGLLQIAARLTDEINKKQRDRANLEDKLADTIRTRDIAQNTLNNNMLTSMGVHDSLIEKGTTLERVQGAVAKAFGNTANEINRANQAGQNFNPKALEISPPTDAGDKIILNLEEQNELLKIQDERQRAVAKAGMEAAKATNNVNQIAAAKRLAGENYDLQKAEEARKKAASEAESQGKRSATQADSIAQKLENLKQQSELAADSTNKLSREQAILNAQLSLGKGATKEQIALAGQYAAAKWDTANAIKAQAAAEKLLPEARENASYKQDVEDLKTALAAKKISQEQYDKTAERLEANHQANLAKIRAQQVVTPQQEAVAQVDPVQQLANQHAQQLALIQQFEQQGLLAHQNALALKNAADTQYEQQRTAAQWELLSQQSLGYSMLTSAVDAFSGNASNALTGLITGTMSAQDAMRSLGNTMLNSVVNALVQVGVEALKNFIIGQTLGAAATAASATEAVFLAKAWAPAAAFASLASFGGNSVPAMTGIASTVGLAQGLALTGMRYNGGPVNAGGLYQVGERGKPEIYRASTGKQYMIPGDNGRVISNKDMQGGNGIIINNIVQNYTSATVDSQGAVNSDGTVTIETIVADLNNGGPISQAITSNHNVKRTPRGQS
ncbi:TPA: tape measure protein [Enterobacter hormaechei subsp. steigerwaltii]|uniref:tape measure protein n=1 Tax=Enterobacter hormaechei TaxID=158836 RepID=UPI003AAE303B|nr:tape measure protein [Enterobacter hormaechei]HCK7268354.1 tape measure protein [Enterobacter hormaechei]HCK7271724.1 tape measure protein [Enterobacter hormaechei]HCK7469077.1 tape measure protein [Enterobacter hormaechei]HCR1984908.1 tape measure protein [Enterobacter hormaechei subsp. steigerwaltii]